MSDPENEESSGHYEGEDDYPVFPNGKYISRFYRVSSYESGLNRRDKFLYNQCYLPYNPQDLDKIKREIVVEVEFPDDPDDSDDPRPNYQLGEPPCKRTAAINANCYFDNTNGTFSGLMPYDDKFDIQQKCYCEKYPYFDSSFGCNACFKQYGGIEGVHWFPDAFMSAASSAYCSASPITTAFYPFISEWRTTDPAGQVPTTTTAPNAIGTQTEHNNYWTYSQLATAAAGANAAQRANSPISQWVILLSVACWALGYNA